MDDKDRPIESLKAELEKAKEREKDYMDSRRAMLFLLEDLNESSALMSRAKEQWDATFDAISDPLFIVDNDLNIVRANAAYARYAGKPFKEIIGRPYYRVFPVMDKPFNHCVEAVKGGTDADAGVIAVPSFDKTFKVRFYPISDEHGTETLSVHILEDITAAKRFEDRLREEVEITTSLLILAEATARTKDIDALLSETTKLTAKILKADACMSYVADAGGAVFYPRQAFGLGPGQTPLFRTEHVDGGAWFIKGALRGKDAVLSHARFESQAPGQGARPFQWFGLFETMLILPLAGKAEAFGILALVYRPRHELTPGGMRLARGIMHQVSTALEEARLYKESLDRAVELSHRIETIRVMHEIDKGVLSTLDAGEILETTARLVSKVIPCDRATIVAVDRERGGFVYQAGFGIDMPKGVFVPFTDTSGASMIETGMAQFTADINEEKPLLPLEKRFAEQGFVSHIRVPIAVKGEITAVLTVGSKKQGIFKPEDLATLEGLASQIGVALENSRLVTGLQELFLSTVEALSKAIDAKSPWTMGHSARVTNYAVAIANELGMDKKTLDDLRIAGLLHDIGKIGTYDEILNKPGKLTDEEYAVMKEHPGKGADMLAPIRQLRHLVPWIKYHHERFDGKGYPDGLKAEDIPLQARVIAVADTFDSMTAKRPYRETPGWDRAVGELKKFSGLQFDPDVVEAFMKVEKVFRDGQDTETSPSPQSSPQRGEEGRIRNLSPKGRGRENKEPLPKGERKGE
ncbi:MAG: HD domain-containing protein [Deltaproteobacteria bacterium]|nr:HD domain-containing protein [Deltaproteobacteria bacterium]